MTFLRYIFFLFHLSVCISILFGMFLILIFLQLILHVARHTLPVRGRGTLLKKKTTYVEPYSCWLVHQYECRVKMYVGLVKSATTPQVTRAITTCPQQPALLLWRAPLNVDSGGCDSRGIAARSMDPSTIQAATGSPPYVRTDGSLK